VVSYPPLSEKDLRLGLANTAKKPEIRSEAHLRSDPPIFPGRRSWGRCLVMRGGEPDLRCSEFGLLSQNRDWSRVSGFCFFCFFPSCSPGTGAPFGQANRNREGASPSPNGGKTKQTLSLPAALHPFGRPLSLMFSPARVWFGVHPLSTLHPLLGDCLLT